jgi:hypothetical protein
VYGYNCLNGIIFPAIYVDMEHLQDDKVVDNVIQHELQHYKVRDNIWQFIRVVCLIIQWYNPLVWWAYVASKRDCELACDARTVRGMSEKERYDYGKSLLTVIEYTFKERQNMNLTTPMVGNKKFMEQRIKIIMKYKNKRAIIISAVIICMVVIVGFISVKMYTNNDINDTDNQEASSDISTEGEKNDLSQEIAPTEQTDTTYDLENKIYSNASITLEYFDDWSIQEESGEDGGRISFFDSNDNKIFWFEQYEAWRANLDATEEEYEQMLENEYENVEILEMSKTTISDYDANKIVFTYSIDEHEYVTVIKYVGFEFNYVYDKDSKYIYEDAINKILDSISFTIE